MIGGAIPPAPRASRAALVALGLVVASLGACFQELDSGASSAQTSVDPNAPVMHTVDLMTPAIGLPAGSGPVMETDDACMATTVRATAILTTMCAPCHGGGPGQNLGQPPFDYVLDVAKLLTAVSSTVKDPVTMQPVRFLVPGDPDHSRIYVRMFKREMPPGDVVGLPPNPNRPNVSDISVIRQWIGHCLGTQASDGQGQDDGSDATKPSASPDAAAAPVGEADAAAAPDPSGPPGGGPPGRDAGGPTRDGSGAAPETAPPPLDAGATDTGRRRFDGGARGGG
jgi:hypothetical protein